MMRNIAVVLSGRDAGLARTLGAAAGSIRAFDQQVTGMGTRGSKAMAGLKFALQAIGVAAAIALGAAVVAAVRFEQSMRNVNTILQLSEPQFKALSASVLELSTQVPQSATTLAKGLYQIVSSGFEAADAMTVLEASAVAASAGITDTDTAARTIVGVLNAYGLEAEDAAYVSDVLFKTVELGVITFEELANELGEVNAGAAAAGITIEEVGAAIATMTLSGLQASEATTSLNRLVRELINPTDELAQVFRTFGYESGLAAVQERGLHGVMELVRVATGGQIDALVRLFPEIRAARGAFALMTAGGTVYNRVFNEMNDRTDIAGATQRAFQEQMKALGNQFQVFKNQVTAVGIAVGTRLIPVLRSAMEGAQRLGPQIGDAFRSMWNAAQPAIRAIGDALKNIVDLFKTVATTVGPVIGVMAGMTFAAAIAGLTGLAKALSVVAGFLADHPALVMALAAVWGGAIIGRLLTAAAAFIRLQTGMIALRIGLFGLVEGTLMAGLATLATRLAGVAAAFGVFLTGNFTGAGIAFAASIRGIGAALATIAPTLIGGALVGGFIALTTAMQNAKTKAEDLVTGLKDQFDLTSLAGLRAFVDESGGKLAELDQDWDNMVGTSNRWSTAARRLYENLNPFATNAIEENMQATGALREEQERARQKLMMWDHDIVTLSNTLGMSRSEIEKWLQQLEGYDPTDTAQTTQMLADEIRVMALEAAHASPAAIGLRDAIETMGDPAATAQDRIDALDASIEGLIGTLLEVSNAAIGFEAAIDDISAAVEENGRTLDITTEQGRAVAGSVNDAAEAAIKHAQAVAQETGSVAQGVDVLKKHRQALIDTMVQSGFSQQAAEAYIATLGLTPENINTLVQLGGAEEAIFTAEQFQETLRLVDLAKVNPTVNINSAKFDDDAIKIGTVLAQIGAANPEAHVLLNGEQFTPTAEMVQAWALMWDASSPEAKAILDIIDPEGKFATLQEAASNWDAANPTATANVDSGPATTALAVSANQLENWDRSTGTADVYANNQPANSSIGDSAKRLAAWNASRGTGKVLANNNDEKLKIAASKDRLANWDRSKGTGDLYAADHASGTINAVMGLLRNFGGTVATATLRLQVIGLQEANRAAALKDAFRYGGISMQDGGLIHAQQGLITTSPTVLFGERATGGEAFIPRYGNANRSKSILAHAASWYGMEVVPIGDASRPTIYDLRSHVTVSVSARSIMDGKTLVQAVRDTTRAELEDHDRRLLRALKSQ